MHGDPESPKVEKGNDIESLDTLREMVNFLPERMDKLEKRGGGELDAVVDRIQEIQNEKETIIELAEAAIDQIDDEGKYTAPIEDGAVVRTVGPGEDGEMLIFGKGGAQSPVSKGQLLVAGLWDESHNLNEGVSVDFMRSYVLTRAKYQLAQLRDTQIALCEANQKYNANTGRDESYKAIAALNESGEGMSNGLMAEKMVESFMTKMMHDHDVPYRIKSVSVYEDVEYKIDFILEPIADAEMVGVGTTEPHDNPGIGVQFTTMKRPKAPEDQSKETDSQRMAREHWTQRFDHKKSQLKRVMRTMEKTGDKVVDDLVFVSLPLDSVRQARREWEDAGPKNRAPGGPDELWSEAEKKKVFFGLLKSILPEEALESAWPSTAG